MFHVTLEEVFDTNKKTNYITGLKTTTNLLSLINFLLAHLLL
jgi:hypothetical protein